MTRIRPALFFKKFKPNHFLVLQALKLVAVFVILVTLPIISSLQLGKTLPLNYEAAVIEIEKPSPIPTPSPTPTPQPVKKQVEEKAVSTKKEIKVQGVSDKTLSELCKGVVEKWKFVPNPDEEGQYVICNAGNGQMATVSELNDEQNKYRVKNGLNALSISSDLCKVADERAHEIANGFNHSGFEAAIDRNNIQKSSVGENIASGPLTAVQFIDSSWDKSAGHKANMLGDWSEGCAGAYDRFAVFIFAK